MDAVTPKLTNDFKIYNERHIDRFNVDFSALRQRPKDYLHSNLGGRVSKGVSERMMENIAKEMKETVEEESDGYEGPEFSLQKERIDSK